MTWDFVECNPFSRFDGKLDGDGRLGARAQSTTYPRTAPWAKRYSAMREPECASVGTVAVSTDPPYYDNISYADLPTSSIVWLRRNLGGRLAR